MQRMDTAAKAKSGRAVENLPLRVVEGVYSLHPKWSGLFDLKIFLKASLPLKSLKEKVVHMYRCRRKNGGQ